VPADPGTALPGYNGLRAVNIADGRVEFTFKGLNAPVDKTGNFVVQALLAQPPGQGGNAAFPLKAWSVAFLGFPAPNRFALAVNESGGPLAQAQLRQLFFMIEVSQYA
jgi:hypothetical protein